MPGLAALNKGGNASVNSVSCASAGNCSATGRAGGGPFVVSETKGTWGKAEVVPGLAVLDQGGNDSISGLSCASAGNCATGGSYTDSSGTGQAWVASQVHGTWEKAQEMDTPSENIGPAGIASISCASASTCSAAGDFIDTSFYSEAFVVSEVKGAWGQAESFGYEGSGLGDWPTTLSCPSAGNCTAGGEFGDLNENVYVWVQSQVHGSWQDGEQVPGTNGQNGGPDAGISVSCAAAGNCTAGGLYDNGNTVHDQAFVDSQVSGTWGQAWDVRGLSRLNTGRVSGIGPVSCGAVGNCTVAGSYTDSSGQQGFVDSQVSGRWDKAVPAAAALQIGSPSVRTLSCASAGHCSAGGSYTDSSGHQQAWVDSRT